MRTGLPGHFNVANALGALRGGAGDGGRGRETAAAGLARAARVPGRFEPIDEGQGFAVLVDYAHTPDSLENVLRAARRLTAGRLISVFGAGGDRDRDKRPKMGRAGAELADLAVVTSDNPRSEDPEAIVAEVARRGRAAAPSVEVEVDRRAAIALALGRAEPGDTVVIAGKGHEQGQEFEGGRKIPFDDREVAREELREAGQPGVKLSAERDRGGAAGPRSSPRASRAAAPRPTIDSARGRRRRPLLRPARRQRATAASSPPAAIAAGAWGVVVGPSASSVARSAQSDATSGGLGLRGRRPAGGAAGAGPGLAPGARRPRRRRHRLGRQDLGQGHRPGAAARAGPRQPREPQHRDRAAADRARGARRTPSCWCWRWRCAAPARSPSWRRSPSPRWR